MRYFCDLDPCLTATVNFCIIKMFLTSIVTVFHSSKNSSVCVCESIDSKDHVPYFRYPINTKSYCFERYEQKLVPKRNYLVCIDYRLWSF